MKKYLFVFILGLIMIEGKSQNDSSLFRLGIQIDSIAECISGKEIAVAYGSGNIKQGLKCEIDGVAFNIAYSKNREVVYYSTTDTNFLINNFRYLTKNKTVVDSLKKETIVFNYDQGFYIDLPQGWKLGFYLQDIITRNKKYTLKKHAKPDYIFKRYLK